MSTIKINSKTNATFAVTANPDPASAFFKYLKSAPAELLLAGEVTDQWEKKLTETKLEDVALGVEFKYPVHLGSSATELTINAKAVGKISVKKKADSNVISDDYFGDAIKVHAGKAYVTLALEATLGAGVNPKTGALSFGFDAGKTITLSYAQEFDEAASLGAAIIGVIENFHIPAEVEDIESMPVAGIAIAEGAGSFSIKATYAAATTPNLFALATPDPIPIGKISISAKAEAKVAGTATFTGDYQVLAHRESETKIAFGYRHSRKEELDVQFTADTGIDAQVNGKSALDQILKSLSGEEKLDAKELVEMGIPADEIKAMNDAVKASLSQSFNLSASADLNWSDQICELFRYSFQPGNLGAAGREWIHHALDGIPAALLAQDDQHLADEHITREAARLKTEVQSGVMLKVNLLGIFNYRSLSQLIKDGTLLCEPVSGSLTFTNKATARNISIAATPFAKIDKLQKVLMENVLFSLACHATGSAGSEELCVTHDFFEYKSRMDSRRFADDMNALVAMGLIDPQKEIEILKKSITGKCVFWLSASFNTAQCRNLLLYKPSTNDPERARPEDFYAQAGRRALRSITESNPDEAFRGDLISREAIWQSLTEKGNPEKFGEIPEIQKLTPDQQATVATDFLAITWWADAMHALGQALLELDQYVANHQPLDSNSSEFRKVRTRFSGSIANAAKYSKTSFGEPWGVLAMDFASNSQDSAIGVIAANPVNLQIKR